MCPVRATHVRRTGYVREPYGLHVSPVRCTAKTSHAVKIFCRMLAKWHCRRKIFVQKPQIAAACVKIAIFAAESERACISLPGPDGGFPPRTLFIYRRASRRNIGQRNILVGEIFGAKRIMRKFATANEFDKCWLAGEWANTRVVKWGRL